MRHCSTAVITLGCDSVSENPADTIFDSRKKAHFAGFKAA